MTKIVQFRTSTSCIIFRVRSSMSDLVVCVLLAAPAWTEVLDRHAQVAGREVEQHLFGFVE